MQHCPGCVTRGTLEDLKRITVHGDPCEGCDPDEEVVALRAKVAVQVEEMNRIIRQKWDVENRNDALRAHIAALEADLAQVTGEIDTYQEMIADLQASVKRVIDERDALSGAMTAEMSGVALAYAAMKTERDRLQRIVDGHELISMRYATLRAALTQCVEALTGLLSQKPAIDGEPHAFWNHNAPSLWVTEYRRGQDALAHAQAVLADK